MFHLSHTRPECRLINPSKTHMGKISKVIWQNKCMTLRKVWNINQWPSTDDSIKCFKDYDKDIKCSFISMIYKNLTHLLRKDKALNLAKEHMLIPEDKINIIKLCY